MKLYLKNKLDGKNPILIYEDGETNPVKTLYNFFEGCLNIKPKKITLTGALDSDVLSIVLSNFDLVIKDENLPKTLDVKEICDNGKYEDDKYILLKNTIDFDRILNIVKDIIGKKEFKNEKEYFLTLTEAWSYATDMFKNSSYIKKLMTIPFYLSDVYINSAPGREESIKIYKLLENNKGEKIYLTYYPGDLIPLIYKKSKFDKVNKKVNKLIEDIYIKGKNIDKVIEEL